MDTSVSRKEAIIRAAGEIFIENGYRMTTIRQICARAGVNVAAVNYYFVDKKNLYMEVLRYYKGIAFKKYPPDMGIKKSDPPQQKLKSFIRSFITRTLEEGPSAGFGKLMAREFVEPTDVLDELINDVIGPSFLMLTEIVREICGRREAEDDAVNLCAMSILGQCLYFRTSSRIVNQMLKKKQFSPQEINDLAQHVYQFSLFALKNYFKTSGKVKTSMMKTVKKEQVRLS